MKDSNEQNLARPAEAEQQVSLFIRIREWLRSDLFKCILMNITAALIVFVIFCLVCVPKKYDLSAYSIAPETIKATKDVTDEVTTRNRREEAASGIEVYKDITEELLASLNTAFMEIRSARENVRISRETALNKAESSAGENNEVNDTGETAEGPDDVSLGNEFTGDEIKLALSALNILVLPEDQAEEQILFILNMSPDELNNLEYLLCGDGKERTGIVEAILRDNTFREDSTDRINESIYEVMDTTDLQHYRIILRPLLDLCLKPNFVISQEMTEEARQKAMEAVEPIIYLQGRTIIREGEPVYEYQLAMLRALGLLNDQTTDYYLYIGSAVVVFVAMACLLMSIKLLRGEILTDVRKLAVILIILILSIIMAALAHLFPSQYIIPLTMGAILGTVLIGYRSGLCLTFALSILFAGLTSGNASSTFYDVVLLMSMRITEGLFAVWFLKGHPQRVRVLIAGPLSSLIGFMIALGISWLTSSGSLDILSLGGWLLAGGALSGALALAFQPVLEQLFRLATPSRLLELTNPNQPLMKRLMIEAPGTYHHSIIVANLAEAAADSIQANPYLARAGAYYHDIGKLKRPGYFKENQNGDNPHERTDPYVSAAILISHTMDGVLLAQKEHMPRELQDIILQHHGVTPVMFFYHKALQMSDGSHVDIDEFRYSGPKPKTKEAAIVMLADTIEAAVRSMKDPTPKGIDQFIERLVRGKLEDGQLSDSPLSLSDIDKICDAFSGILRGVYHERIEYPHVPHYADKNIPVPESAEKNPEGTRNADSPQAAPAVSNVSAAEKQKTETEQPNEKTAEESSGET